MSTSDIVEIEQLLYSYSFAVDRGGPDDVAALFAETAVLVPKYSGGAPAEGRAAVRQWYVDYQKTVRGAVDFLRHCIHNPKIEVRGDQADAICYFTADSLSKTTGKASWVAGFYQDRLVKQNGRWLFAERQIHTHYATESTPPRG